MCGLDPMRVDSNNLQESGDQASMTEREQALSAHAQEMEQKLSILEQPILPILRSSSSNRSLVPLSSIAAASAHSPAPLDNGHAPAINTEDLFLTLFTQRLQQPSLDLPVMRAPAAAEAVPGQKCFHSMLLLSVPAVPPDHSSVTVRQHIGRALLQSMPALVISHAPADADIANGITFHELIAPGQVLSDTFQTLPVVMLEDPGHARAEASAVTGMLKGLQLKSRNLAVSELLLDWSMTDASAPDPTSAGSRARNRLRAALTPEALPCAESALAAAPWAELLLIEIAGPPVHCSGLQPRPEQLPSAVQKFLCSKGSSRKGGRGMENTAPVARWDRAAAASAPPARLSGRANRQSTGGMSGMQPSASRPTHAPDQPGSRAEEVAAAGIFSKRPAKKAKNAAGKDDASFFFGLQTGALGSQDSAIDDASSSSRDSLLGRYAS